MILVCQNNLIYYSQFSCLKLDIVYLRNAITYIPIRRRIFSQCYYITLRCRIFSECYYIPLRRRIFSQCYYIPLRRRIFSQCYYIPLPRPVTSCAGIQEGGTRVSGIYTIYVEGDPLSVSCDLGTAGGGWTVSGLFSSVPM